MHSVAWRYRQRYNLPLHDPRFLQTTVEEMYVDEWAARLSQLEEVALRRLAPEKITLDVLLKGMEQHNIEQGLDSAAAEADLERREAEAAERRRGTGAEEVEPVLHMDFTQLRGGKYG